jgi:hypothetical protein
VTLRTLGPESLTLDADGYLTRRVATIFPAGQTLVTVPGIHATQRAAYVEDLDRRREAAGQAPLNNRERTEAWDNAVDLIIQREHIQIRPDPQKIDLAFQADALLQQRVPIHRIRFLMAADERVHTAIKRRGESWRIAPRPMSTADMVAMIRDSRLGIAGREIYFHSPITGTRLLTCDAFAQLANLTDEELQQHLIEIQHYSRCFNSLRNPEIDFFIAGRKIRDPLLRPDFSLMKATDLRSLHAALCQQFQSLVPPDIRRDDPENIQWRQWMLAALQPLDEDRVLQEDLLGLAAEFHMHVQWLPGGRIEAGELIFDPIFDVHRSTDNGAVAVPVDEKARSLIFNYVRDYGDLEYINVGRIDEQLTLQRPRRGRREVYVVQMKQLGSEEDIVKIIRLQKWDVSKHLDDGKDLLGAMLDSEAYTEYILDRRLGCRRLGMNLPSYLATGRISEIYDGPNPNYRGCRIWTPYFERDYIHGMATDKIPKSRFSQTEYALKFATLLGRAAAPNLLVGRCDDEGRVFFDDGDEVIIEDAQGLPKTLLVTHHTGAFADYDGPLGDRAAVYAAPVNRRLEDVPCPQEFATAYLDAMADHLREIQATFRCERRAFASLFRLRELNPDGSFAYRWECVLRRLDRLDIPELAEQIGAAIAL